MLWIDYTLRSIKFTDWSIISESLLLFVSEYYLSSFFVLTLYCVKTKIAFFQLLFTICQLAHNIFHVECQPTLSTILLLSRPIALLYICLWSCTNACNQTIDLLVCLSDFTIYSVFDEFLHFYFSWLNNTGIKNLYQSQWEWYCERRGSCSCCWFSEDRMMVLSKPQCLDVRWWGCYCFQPTFGTTLVFYVSNTAYDRTKQLVYGVWTDWLESQSQST